MTTVAAVHPGFGDYHLPEGKSFAQMQTAAKVQKIFLTLFHIAFTVLSIVLIPVFWPIGLVGAAVFSYQAIRSILALIGLFYRAPPMQNLFPKEILAPPLGELSDLPCSGFATRDGVESQEWKLNLIKAAKHAIFISGCYCGGKAFDETLDLIHERMRLNHQLTTSILASNMFITKENQQKIEALEKAFGDRFHCVVTPEVFPFVSPATDDLTITTNHTKALVIDYGAAFMVGGSGIVSPWSEQPGHSPPVQKESHGFVYDYFMKAKAYRDMDFVFQSPPHGIGLRLHLEMTKLLQRFSSKPIPLVTQFPPREPIPMARQMENLKIACYATGPEQPIPYFQDALIDAIAQAKKRIVIGHMYFHPTPKLLQALIDASNRGIEIILITNKLGSQSPGLHLTYAELSRYYAKQLFEGKAKPNVHYYEHDVPYTTFHKKTIVIDDATFNGSANIGKKSLEGADYELDLKVESPEFANATLQILEEDKKRSHEDSSPEISLKTRLFSFFQSLFVPVL